LAGWGNRGTPPQKEGVNHGTEKRPFELYQKKPSNKAGKKNE